MMESAGCVRKTENLCSGRDGFWFLEDRRGKRLPVRCRCGTCSNTIYNAVPLSLHQFAGRGLYREAPVHLCMFTTESAGQTRKILDLFTDLQRQEGEAFITSLTASSRTGKKKKRPAGKDSARPVSGSGKGPGGGKKENSPLPFDDFTNGHFKTGAL
jgi:putative protease